MFFTSSAREFYLIGNTPCGLASSVQQTRLSKNLRVGQHDALRGGGEAGIGRGLDNATIVSPKLSSRKFSDLRFVCLKMSVC